MHNESGRSLIEMMMVLALIGLMTIGSIKAYQSGNDQNEANKIHELVSTASLNALTKMRKLCNVKESCPSQSPCFRDGYKHSSGTCVRCCSSVWDVIGKNKTDYKCVSSLEANSNGSVKISFKADCDKVKKTLTSQWGRHWNSGNNTYTPPKDDE